MKEIKDKGLSYYFESKWSPWHKSQSPKRYLLEDVLLEEEFSEVVEEKQYDKAEEATTIELIVAQRVLKFHSMP